MRSQISRRRIYNDPGHAHELTFSCYHGYRFLQAHQTCLWLAEAIDRARREQQFALWAYVFMPEHVHLIVRPTQADYQIALILRSIKQPVARRAMQYLASHAREWLPRLTQRRGQRTLNCFWQPGGGYDRNITSPETLRLMIDYIHLNPVRRGLVAQARDWKWSSASWFEGFGPGGLVPDEIPPEWTD